MRFGVCAPISEAAMMAEIGFDYLEVGASGLAAMTDEEFDARMKEFTPKTKQLSGYLKRYAALVSSGAKGAVLN